MTAVCLKAKNSVKTDTWSSVFTSFNTYTKSCLFVQQLTRTCISTILHLRKVFPDDYFEAKNFEGISLKLLKPTKGENYVSKIEQWLEGAFEAIEKKYLKRLMLDIQDADSNMTLEIYTMTFNYNNEGETIPTLNKNSDFTVSNTKLSAIKLLQMCFAVTQTYGSLPSQIKLSMRLSYYENTPEDYQPRGYMSWKAVDPEFPKQARSIEIGNTSTQHHFFKLLNKSCLNDKFLKEMKHQFECSNSDALPMHSPQLVNIPQERHTKAKRELCFDNTSNNTGISLRHSSEIKNEIKFMVTEKHLTIPNANHSEILNNISKNKTAKKTKGERTVKGLPIKGDLKMRCACLCNDKSNTTFQCLSCRFLVHAECFGILEYDSSRKIRFYCHLCHEMNDDFKCHDKVIVSLKSSSDQQKLSILRRALRHCTLPNVTKITLKKMEKIAGANCFKTVANVVLNKMIEIGVAIPQGKKKNYLINKQELSAKLVHYFYRVQNTLQSHSQEQFKKQVTAKSVRTSEKTSKRKNKLENVDPAKRIMQPTNVLQELQMGNKPYFSINL